MDKSDLVHELTQEHMWAALVNICDAKDKLTYHEILHVISSEFQSWQHVGMLDLFLSNPSLSLDMVSRIYSIINTRILNNISEAFVTTDVNNTLLNDEFFCFTLRKIAEIKYYFTYLYRVNKNLETGRVINMVIKALRVTEYHHMSFITLNYRNSGMMKYLVESDVIKRLMSQISMYPTTESFCPLLEDKMNSFEQFISDLVAEEKICIVCHAEIREDSEICIQDSCEHTMCSNCAVTYFFGKFLDSLPATCPMCRQQVKQWTTSAHLKFYRSHRHSQFTLNVNHITRKPECKHVSQYFLNNECVRDSAIINIAFVTTQIFQDLNEKDPKRMLEDLLYRLKEVHNVYTTQKTKLPNFDKVIVTAYPVFFRLFRRAVDLCGRAGEYLESVKMNNLNKDDCSFQRDLSELKRLHGDICSSSGMGTQMQCEQTPQITKMTTRSLRQYRYKPLRRSPRNHSKMDLAPSNVEEIV